VGAKEGLLDAEGQAIAHDIADIGISTPVRVRSSYLYWIEGVLDRAGAESLATRLLADPVAQEYSLSGDLRRIETGTTTWIVEVFLKPGVTDVVADSVLKGARDIGIRGLTRAATGRKYYLTGDLSEAQVRSICERLLLNAVIQSYRLRRGDDVSFSQPAHDACEDS